MSILDPLPVVTVREGSSPLVLSMPHSGTAIPSAVTPAFRPEALAVPDTDWHIPTLYGFADELDATVIRANYSRYVIDLNRPPTGESLYPGQATTGLCPTTFFDGRPLYVEGGEPNKASIAERVTHFWQPYHDAVAAQLARVRKTHGRAVLYDCHSIASEVPRLFDGVLPVLNLGTARGESCRVEVERSLEAIMGAADFETVVNGRFVGGYITRHYGQPAAGVDAVQMEIGQDGYMDRVPTFAYREDLAARLQPVLRELLVALEVASKPR